MTTSALVFASTVGILILVFVFWAGFAKKLPSWMEPRENMDIVYKLNLGSWQSCSILYFYAVVVPQMKLTDRVELRLECGHSHTKIGEGLRTCSDCNEVLEVTSHRD